MLRCMPEGKAGCIEDGTSVPFRAPPKESGTERWNDGGEGRGDGLVWNDAEVGLRDDAGSRTNPRRRV